jgi:hypothetical protein
VSASIRVYVNAQPVEVTPGSTVAQTLEQWNREEAQAVTRGERAVTDSRGLPAGLADAVVAGSILRVVGARAAK